MSYIILRDMPKEEVRLDLNIYEVKGGFRGFADVPKGLHYISVKDGDEYKSFWSFSTENQAIVKRLDYETGKFTDDIENEEHYSKLALSGAMNKALILYKSTQQQIWEQLIKHISVDSFPPKLNHEKEEPMPEPGAEDYAEQIMTRKSRFELAFYDSNKGNSNSFLSELEFSFLRFITDQNDNEAFDRWRHLILSLYNAGERCIEDNPNLFIDLIDILITQFKLLPKEYLVPDSFIIQNASYLAEDMIDTGIDNLEEKGKEFKLFIKKFE